MVAVLKTAGRKPIQVQILASALKANCCRVQPSHEGPLEFAKCFWPMELRDLFPVLANLELGIPESIFLSSVQMERFTLEHPTLFVYSIVKWGNAKWLVLGKDRFAEAYVLCLS